MSIEVTNADVSWGNTETIESTSDEMLISIGDLKNYLLGKILTIVDATYADTQQRKAVKDLVRSAIHSREYYSDQVVHLLHQFNGKDATEWLDKVEKERVPMEA